MSSTAARTHGSPAAAMGPRAWRGRLGLLVVLALALRAWGLQGQSLSMDEFAELHIAKRAIREIVFSADGFPPLYNVLLHGWLAVFSSDAAARWLSVGLGTLSVLLIGKLAKDVAGPRAGIATAFLLAISPIHIWHSQEGRAYILYFLMAVLALWTFFRALGTDGLANWLWYALASVVGLWTHYYFAILLLVNGLIILVERRTWRQLREPVLAHVAIAVASLPLMWIARADFAAEATAPFATPFRLAALGYTYFSFIAGYSIGPSVRELHTTPFAQAIPQFLPWLLIVGAAVAALGYSGYRALGTGTWRWRLVALAVIPVFITTLAALLGLTFQVRHVLWVAIPILLWLGAGLSFDARRWPSIAAVTGLAAVCAVSLFDRNYVDRYQNEDLRALSGYLKSRSANNAPVLVSPGYMSWPVRYYVGPGWTVDSLPDVDARGGGLAATLRAIDQSVAAGSTFWLVYSRPFHGDPHSVLKDALIEQRNLQHRADFVGIALYQGTRP